MRAVFCGTRPYEYMLSLQLELFHRKIVAQKTRQRAMAAGGHEAAQGLEIPRDVILAVEHSHPVYTMGKRDTSSGLHLSDAEAKVKDGIPVVHIRRGGGLTWHGPGQLTVYPIANIRQWWTRSLTSAEVKGKSPIRWYSDVLEESMASTVRHFNVPAERGCVGVWIPQVAASPPSTAVQCEKGGSPGTRKVGSIGLQLSDWVSMHGVGLNISNDVKYFDNIVMCEMPTRRATTLQMELRDRGAAESCPTVREAFAVWMKCFTEQLALPDDDKDGGDVEYVDGGMLTDSELIATALRH